jgi:hypothetical protein
MRNRFERLFIRWQNGTLTRPRPPRPARAPDRTPPHRCQPHRCAPHRFVPGGPAAATTARFAPLRGTSRRPPIPAPMNALPAGGVSARAICYDIKMKSG